jgi:hypothetical protein
VSVPLLAYFKLEGDDDLQLQGTDLKERFDQYLIEHHGSESQIIIIENQHPSSTIEAVLTVTVLRGILLKDDSAFTKYGL